jgi:hypothetical protein
MSDKKHLSNKEMKFAQMVAEGYPKTDAVIEAGYNPGSRVNASSMGHQLSKRPRIRQKIEELRLAQGRKLMENLPDLLKEMLDLALGKSKASGYNARVQFEALRDLLDRIPGMGKKEKIQITDDDFPAELLRMLNRLNTDEGEA